MRLLLCFSVFLAAGFFPSTQGFVAVTLCPRSSWRQGSGTAALQAQEDGSSAAAAPPTASPGSSDDLCPGYPRCSGEYREKGCDGTGRISGGVGALLPWLPIKAYRPCPAFTEAKYKYTRQGQSLNEVVFARRQGTMSDITMDDSFGAMKEEEVPPPDETKGGAGGNE
ncbi:unnamed protein product, partial [Hapterophycus canaliculatus]